MEPALSAETKEQCDLILRHFEHNCPIGYDASKRKFVALTDTPNLTSQAALQVFNQIQAFLKTIPRSPYDFKIFSAIHERTTHIIKDEFVSKYPTLIHHQVKIVLNLGCVDQRITVEFRDPRPGYDHITHNSAVQINNVSELRALYTRQLENYTLLSLEPTQKLLMSNGTGTKGEVPPVVPGVKIEQLLDMFNKLDFKERKLTIDGFSSDPEAYRRNMKQFFDTINGNKKYSGVPENEEERIAYYQDLRGYLTNCIVNLSKLEKKEEYEMYLLDLLEGCGRCGGRWMSAALYVWQSTSNKMAVDSDNLENVLFKLSDTLKLGIVSKILAKDNNTQSAHGMIRLIKLLAVHGIYVPGYMGANYRDVYANLGVGGHYNTEEKILCDFRKEFAVENLAPFFLEKLNECIKESNGRLTGPLLDVLREFVKVDETVPVQECEQTKKEIDGDPALQKEAVEQEVAYGKDVLKVINDRFPQSQPPAKGDLATTQIFRSQLTRIHKTFANQVAHAKETLDKELAKNKESKWGRILAKKDFYNGIVTDKQNARKEYEELVTNAKKIRIETAFAIKKSKIEDLKDERLRQEGYGIWEGDMLVQVNTKVVLAILNYFKLVQPLTPG